MDLYSKLGDELRVMFTDLFNPKREEAVHREMENVLRMARELGGAIQNDAELLHNDVLKFLANRNNPKTLSRMKDHALRLEQETREI